MEILSQPDENQVILIRNDFGIVIGSMSVLLVVAEVFCESENGKDDFLSKGKLISPIYNFQTTIWISEICHKFLEIELPLVDAPKLHKKICKRVYFKFSESLQTNKFYALLAGRHFLKFATQKSLPSNLLSKPIKQLTENELDFMTVIFEHDGTYPQNFNIKYQDGTSHSFSESFFIPKNTPCSIPIGFGQKNYQSFFPNKKISSVEVVVGGQIQIIESEKPIRFRQEGSEIVIERQSGSFLTDGWGGLNFPYYLSIWFFWNNNPNQTFSLLGLIGAGGVGETQIRFQRIGEPIEDPVTLANENIWLAAELRLARPQAGGISTPSNPDKIMMYGDFGSSSVVGEAAKTIIYPKKSFCDKKFEKNFLYLNAWGALESFLAQGDFIEELNVERESYKKYLPLNYSPQDAQIAHYNIVSFETYKAFSGYLLQEALEKTAKDFLESPQVYLFKKDYGYVPIEILSKKYKTLESNHQLIGVEFEFRYSHDRRAAL